MSIVRYNTANDFVPTSFSHLIDRFFNDSLSRSGGAVYSFVPKVDIFETDKAYEVQLSIPGVNKEDFKIDVDDNQLVISGERKLSKERKENNLYVVQSEYGHFSRAFRLPEDVDASKISAAYTNGILNLTLPKDEKKTLKTSIKVN